MFFDDIATELITQIYLSCDSISDVLALSSACKRFRRIYNSSQKFPILQHAAETQYGPLQDLTQLLTHNASQPAHRARSVPFSLALLRQIARAGRIAETWCTIYPFKKWKGNFECRRVLTASEQRCLRRALYRLWLYTRAFHNREHPRETRMHKLVIQERAALLHNWSNLELAEMADVHAVLRDVLHGNVCPSNGTIARKFRKRFPESEPQLLFNIHLNYPIAPPSVASQFQSPFHSNPNTSALSTHFYTHNAAASSRFHHSRYAVPEPGAEGWGDDIGHYYVIEDMLKLDPEQILWLKENAPLKSQVEMYVRSLGDWFESNGDTWGQTLEWVLNERGLDAQEFLDAIRACEAGVAVTE